MEAITHFPPPLRRMIRASPPRCESP